ncbi:hypothetical protein AAII07_38645 [Microvirga sp. 0TCS3.31]
MTDLKQLLREATEHVASPDFAERALESAHRHRLRRTAAGAIVAVVLLGGGATWIVQDRVPHAGVVDTPRPTRTLSPGPTPTSSVPDTDPATQSLWDPFSLANAERTDSALPGRLAPSVAPPDLADAPLPDIVVAWPQKGADLRVLATNGEWRSVTGTAAAVRGSLRDVVVPAISPGGDRVAMSTNDGILVVSASGARQVVPWPKDLAGPWDIWPELIWRPGDAGFVVQSWKGPWFVDMDGSGTPLPSPRNSYGVMVDPDDGTVRDRTRAHRELRTWNGPDDASSITLAGYGERYVTRFGKVAYTGNPGHALMDVATSGPVVVDPATGEILAFAPILDENSVYSDNGHLTALGFLDPATVLLLVTPMDFVTMEPDDGTTYLATWDWASGEITVLASGGTGMRGIAVAPDLVAAD